MVPWGIVFPCYTASGTREINGPGLSKASGLILSSTITSNVLLSSACSAIDDEVVEKGNTKTKRWNVLYALIVAGMIRYVRKEDK